MAQNIQNFEIAQTFSNVLLTTVTGEPDTAGVSPTSIPAERTGNLTQRDQGRLQDGAGVEIPLVLGINLIECETDPISAYSVMRRADVLGLHAAQFINTMIWS